MSAGSAAAGAVVGRALTVREALPSAGPRLEMAGGFPVRASDRSERRGACRKWNRSVLCITLLSEIIWGKCVGYSFIPNCNGTGSYYHRNACGVLYQSLLSICFVLR